MITQEQRKERKFGIGGSDVPIIFGLSSYKTPYILYLEKKGLIEEDDKQTDNQYWGNLLEEPIIKHFESSHNLIVEKPSTIIHPKYPFLRANVDGYIPSTNTVLEVKCSELYMAHEWGEEGSDFIPMPYLLQVAHYCSCLNADQAIIAVKIGLYGYREYLYKRDLELESMIINQCQKFWDGVQNGIEPDLINLEDARLKYNQAVKSKKIIIDNDLRAHVEKLINLKLLMKKNQELEADLKLKVMNYMQDAEYLIDENETIIATWKNTKRNRTLLIKGV